MYKCSKDWVTRSADVSVAFLNAKIEKGQEVYVRPPKGRDVGSIWKLKKSLYGLRTAPSAWNKHLDQLLTGLGWTRSRIDPGMYYCDKSVLIVHVDDILVTGERATVDHLFQELAKSVILKTYDAIDDNTSLEFLGRIITRKGTEVTMTSDARLVTKSLEELGMTSCKDVSTPGTSRGDDVSELLNEEEHASFRRFVGRLMYISMDRGDVAFSVKSLTRKIASPTRDDFPSMKRVFRYLSTRKTLVTRYDVSLKDRKELRCGLILTGRVTVRRASRLLEFWRHSTQKGLWV